MLFNLAEDISELRDLSLEQPARVADLFRKLHDWEETFERNPIFTSEPHWSRYNDRLYDLEYELTQPE